MKHNEISIKITDKKRFELSSLSQKMFHIASSNFTEIYILFHHKESQFTKSLLYFVSSQGITIYKVFIIIWKGRFVLNCILSSLSLYVLKRSSWRCEQSFFLIQLTNWSSNIFKWTSYVMKLGHWTFGPQTWDTISSSVCILIALIFYGSVYKKARLRRKAFGANAFCVLGEAISMRHN